MLLLWTATSSSAVAQNWDAIKRPFNTEERSIKAKYSAANHILDTSNVTLQRNLKRSSAPPVVGQPTPSDSSAPVVVQPMASTSSGIYAPQLSYLPNLASAQASTSTAILPPIGGAVAPTRPNKRAREELDEDRDSDDSDLGNTVPPAPKASRTQLTYTSNTPSLPKIFLQHPMCLREMFKVTKNHLFNNLSVDACRQSLRTARDSVEEHLKQLDPNIKTTPWTQIPRTIPTLLKTFDLNTTIQSKICCPFCCALHPVLPIDQINMNQLCNHP
ncbi:uncharacterized protein MELLADRAFT_95134 [Melampsora larici-populina 98AG31]|uniref:Uncharacterized protein n=1 Tax=Melampsora larici-populina (strain 98AG31 / pathotype 3-4-7) TaxID=747676 RepID=F4RC87_MELLP|nr:uncharacterized protein MELLADRAFT_95134 [Melampsora larici-populina 98AG31]EGG09995.1 hypothetical protein MELLADRAFT_95134 [Melampsora larici-populina 98AG31]